MNLTCLKRFSCGMSAFLALLACTAPVAVAATSEPVVKKGSPAPAAKKVIPAPVAKKAVATPEAVVKKALRAPVAKKAAPEPVRKTAPPVPVVSAMNAPSIYRVPLGESKVYRFAQPIRRIAVGDPSVADYIMLNHSEIYLLGKKLGSTNLAIWDQQGNLTSAPLQVSRSTAFLQSLLTILFPEEHDIHIISMGEALVLSGSVSDPLVSESVSRVVKGYFGRSVSDENPESALINASNEKKGAKGALVASPSSSLTLSLSSNDGTKTATATTEDQGAGVVNLLKVRDPQQVRLEVRIAQVSKTYIESLGLSVSKIGGGDLTGSLKSLSTGFVSDETLKLVLNPNYSIMMGAKRKPTLFRILAEPTIVTMSGKEGNFLVGGKVYTPVISTNGAVGYEEHTYGVGLRFTPIVLDVGRISLKVDAEDSEPDKTPVTAGTNTILPSFKMSTVSTTVQMKEGENLLIGGLMLDNLTNSIDSVPLLGEIPILGALFRNTQKDAENTELMVIVRPTLVKASTAMPELPTDKIVPPTRGELFIGGKVEGSRKK